MTRQTIPLAEAVQALRLELEEAVAQADGQRIRFDLGPVEVEFTAVVTREAKGGAKASFKVLGVGVEAEGGGQYGREDTHKVKFTLTPEITRAPGATPERVKIGGKAKKALGARRQSG